jgi:hypothetical protein
MNARAKTVVLAFSLVSLLAAPFAEAARMGKSRSYGMRRAAPTQSYQRPAPAAAPAPVNPQQPQKKGVGIGTAVGAGVAGAAAGYMLGSAMNGDKAAAAPSSAPAAEVAPATEQKPGTPWGLVAILGAVLIGGLMWFRRRVGMPTGAPTSMRAANPMSNDPRFDPIPQIGSGFPSSAPGMGQNTASSLTRLPDGTETPYFLRQAKATFLHLQSLNSPDSLDEVRRYMTPELFTELRGEIANNSEVADFTQLDCQLQEAVEENGRYIATVRYFGLVSESVNASSVPFAETWHFVKTAGTTEKWMVAGIQQNS